jgi:folate-binding protein YgfZ
MSAAPDRVRVAGPAAEAYLQGQLSQDVAALAVGSSAPSFLLEPTGKVSAWLQVRRDAADRYTLEVDAGYGAAVVERLSRFKLRTKVDIEAMEPEAETETMPGDGPGEAGEAARIAAGIPRMGAELVPGQTIPAEAGQQIIDRSVSFTKGCYTGQELVARIDSRGGNVPRHLRGLIVEGADAPPEGAEVEVGGTVVGRVTSVAWSPERGRPVALGYVARAVVPPAAATVRWEGGRAPAEVRALPL